MATGPVSPRSTTLPLQHVLELLSGTAPLASLLTENFTTRFSAHASGLSLEGALQFCQVLRITLVDLLLQIPHRKKLNGVKSGREGA